MSVKATKQITAAFVVDPQNRPEEQLVPLHNRWHPEIPAASTQKIGDLFRVECMEWTGGQITNDDSAQDMKDIDLSKVCNYDLLCVDD